jgi:hypothetical protein
MNTYKGIVFPKGYNEPFGKFKEQYASNWIFKQIPSKQREAELKKAHKIAIRGNNKRTTKNSEKANESKNTE